MSKFEKMDESQVKHWQIIYPAYINKKISNSNGKFKLISL